MILPLDKRDKFIIENKQAIYFFRIPAQALCSIILGARISKSVGKFIRLLLARYHRWKHIKLFQAELDEHSMALEYLDDPLKGKIS